MIDAPLPPETISWTSDFDVGIPVIDEEHQTLVALYNDLVHSLERGATQTMSQSMVRSLQRFVIDHMSREEVFIRQHSFPGAEQHIQEHRDFGAAVSALPNGEVAGTVVALLRGWILNHILISDRALFEHVTRSGPPTADRSPSPFAPR